MSMRSQALVEHHGIATGKEMSTGDTLRRGLQLSPGAAPRHLGHRRASRCCRPSGGSSCPFVVQRITDEGILADGRARRCASSRSTSASRSSVSSVTAFSAYFVNVRLFRASENGLSTLRLKAFRHIHDLAMLPRTPSAAARSSRG